MQSIDNKIINRIYGYGRGWAFSKIDFADLGGSEAIRKSLSRLAQSGKIRRVLRGIYDYPKFSKLLNQQLSPDIQQIAFSLARKFNWRIVPTGNTALNLLGISTQLPGRYIYLCDGENRIYEIENINLEFKKTVLKEIGFKYQESTLLVQAIKTLGKEQLHDEIIEKFRINYSDNICQKILKDTRLTTTWIYEIIKQICVQDKI
ncbi:MAG: hypothetical protein HQL46_13020 [Gammaproteobacteria bacterium]|nr:hypothetical protein [Gammaproteobacteria bacterium]